MPPTGYPRLGAAPKGPGDRCRQPYFVLSYQEQVAAPSELGCPLGEQQPRAVGTGGSRDYSGEWDQLHRGLK